MPFPPRPIHPKATKGVMLACPQTTPEATLKRLLDRRHDPLWGWPEQARQECRHLLADVHRLLSALPQPARRVARDVFLERGSEADVAERLALPIKQVHRMVLEVRRALLRALHLSSPKHVKGEQNDPGRIR